MNAYQQELFSKIMFPYFTSGPLYLSSSQYSIKKRSNRRQFCNNILNELWLEVIIPMLWNIKKAANITMFTHCIFRL